MTAPATAPRPATSNAERRAELALEGEISAELHKLQRRMQSGRPLKDTVEDLHALYARQTLARLRLALAVDSVRGRDVITASSRRLGEVLVLRSPKPVVRAEDLW